MREMDRDNGSANGYGPVYANGAPMTDAQISAYLERIGLEERPAQDLDSLARLQWTHMCSVPFENTDIMAGIPLSLDRQALFDKVITRRRGGVCSELNTLYNWLLESLGFQVVSFSSRVISDAVPFPGRSHRIMCVQLGQERYLTDVGYNYEHHRKPLLLHEDLIQSDGECEYFLQRLAVYGWVMFQRPQGSDRPWRKKIAFTEDPNLDSDFTAATFFAQYHPDSKINKNWKLSRYVDGKFYAIRQGNYLTEDGGIVRVLEEGISESRREELTREIFGLDRV